jgi:hypothetical protein
MSYPHKVTVKTIPVPPKNIQVTIESEFGHYATFNDFFATPEEFLEFWKPLVTYYEELNNGQRTSNQ